VPKLGDGLPSSMTYEIATLRDQFAMAALTGILSKHDNLLSERVAEIAFDYADAMMEARK